MSTCFPVPLPSTLPTREVIVDYGRNGEFRIVWGLAESGRYLGKEFFHRECNEDQRSKLEATFHMIALRGASQNEKVFKLRFFRNLPKFPRDQARLAAFGPTERVHVSHSHLSREIAFSVDM
jgi:hypothetical protein